MNIMRWGKIVVSLRQVANMYIVHHLLVTVRHPVGEEGIVQRKLMVGGGGGGGLV